MRAVGERGDLLAALVAHAHRYETDSLAVAPDLPVRWCEDVALANAVLDAERTVMDRRWQALEALLPLIPPGGTVDEVVHLPAALAVRAVLLARACGWAW